MASRIERVSRTEGIDKAKARTEIEKTDKRRADNYRHYTRQIWGHSDHYDLCMDTRMGKKFILKTVAEAIKQPL